MYPSTKGMSNIIKRYILGSAILLVRLPFFLLVFLILLVSQLLRVIVYYYIFSFNYQIVGNALKRLYWSVIVSPLCRLLLFIMGITKIEVTYGESQKLRIRYYLFLHFTYSSVVNPSAISISSIQAHDLIISNYSGYLQVLIYASL